MKIYDRQAAVGPPSGQRRVAAVGPTSGRPNADGQPNVGLTVAAAVRPTVAPAAPDVGPPSGRRLAIWVYIFLGALVC